MRRKIIIDTDPGQDDAIAILLAMASPDKLDILGLIAVAGNAELEHTATNALRIRELADPNDALKMRIYRGCGAPLARKLFTCQGFHGPTGLAGPALPDPTRGTEEKRGVDFLIEILEDSESKSITICTLGPLTDLAKALRTKPHIAGRIGELVMMGGAHSEHGNISPAAEFNMHVDPEAAKIVLDTLSDWGVNITMIPLDATHKVLATPERIEQFRALSNNCGRAAADILEATGYVAYQGWPGMPLHDPCVIAYLLKPDLFSGRRLSVEIETTGQWTTGMTVVDWRNESGRAANVNFITDVDTDGYYRLLCERISELP